MSVLTQQKFVYFMQISKHMCLVCLVVLLGYSPPGCTMGTLDLFHLMALQFLVLRALAGSDTNSCDHTALARAQSHGKAS